MPSEKGLGSDQGRVTRQGGRRSGQGMRVVARESEVGRKKEKNADEREFQWDGSD